MLIGKDIADETIKSIITALDVVIEKEENGVLSVAVPPYRVDVQREADLIEDVLRVYGYNNIEISDHVNSTLSYAPKPNKSRLQNMASDYLSANGYTEIMSNSLTKASYYEGCTTFPVERCVRILNPLSQDLNVMRQTLLFNALEAVELNVNRRNGNLRMYEVGNCYFFDAEKAQEENALAKYDEGMRMGITVTGLATQLSWNSKAEGASFFTLRAMVEKLLKRFGIDLYSLQCESLASDLFADAIVFKQGPKEVLRMGVVSPIVRKKFDIKQEVYFAEIDFDQLVKMTKKSKVQFKELSKFPEVKRDLALLVDKSITFSQLRSIAFATEKKLLKSVSLFDVYEGDKLPEGKKSYALSFILEDKTQTLTDKQIERTMANIQAQLEQKCGAEIRK
jgi:phenylalanyl-tRNA synthetase beta chain